METDSVLIETIQRNTQAVMHLNGSLWVLMGFVIVCICGWLVIRYTLRG